MPELAPKNSDRLPNGRFLPGHSIKSTDNGLTKKHRNYRQALMNAVSEQDVEDVARSMVEAACTYKDVRAATLLFSYLLGKPADTIEIKETKNYQSPTELENSIMNKIKSLRGALDTTADNSDEK